MHNSGNAQLTKLTLLTRPFFHPHKNLAMCLWVIAQLKGVYRITSNLTVHVMNVHMTLYYRGKRGTLT